MIGLDLRDPRDEGLQATGERDVLVEEEQGFGGAEAVRHGATDDAGLGDQLPGARKALARGEHRAAEPGVADHGRPAPGGGGDTARAVKNVLPDLPDAEDRLDRTYPGDQLLTRQHRFAGAQRRFGVDTDEVEQPAHLLRAANHCMLSGQIADAGGALCSDGSGAQVVVGHVLGQETFKFGAGEVKHDCSDRIRCWS